MLDEIKQSEMLNVTNINDEIDTLCFAHSDITNGSTTNLNVVGRI